MDKKVFKHWHQVAALVQDIFMYLCLLKNHKIDNPTTNKSRLKKAQTLKFVKNYICLANLKTTKFLFKYSIQHIL